MAEVEEKIIQKRAREIHQALFHLKGCCQRYGQSAADGSGQVRAWAHPVIPVDLPRENKESEVSEMNEQKIQEVMEQYTVSGEMPGGSLSVHKSGELVYQN